MGKYLWPWQAHVLVEYPWAIYIMFMILSIPLSIIAWKRQKK